MDHEGKDVDLGDVDLGDGRKIPAMSEERLNAHTERIDISMHDVPIGWSLIPRSLITGHNEGDKDEPAGWVLWPPKDITKEEFERVIEGFNKINRENVKEMFGDE